MTLAVVQIPQQILETLVFCSFVYWFTGMAPSAAKYFTYMLVVFTNTLAIGSGTSCRMIDRRLAIRKLCIFSLTPFRPTTFRIPRHSSLSRSGLVDSPSRDRKCRCDDFPYVLRHPLWLQHPSLQCPRLRHLALLSFAFRVLHEGPRGE